jgi:hypothetical protein
VPLLSHLTTCSEEHEAWSSSSLSVPHFIALRCRHSETPSVRVLALTGETRFHTHTK